MFGGLDLEAGLGEVLVVLGPSGSGKSTLLRALAGFRLALGIGWVLLVPAEMLGVDSGLGYEILNARDRLAFDQMMGVILVIGALGYALDALARYVLAPSRPA